MRVLLLGDSSEELLPFLDSAVGPPVSHRLDANDLTRRRVDTVVSFGYRHLLNGDLLSLVEYRCFNLHISLLPWNRGADPNFWSWVENTPKGVSIHQMTQELDAGAIVRQAVVPLDETLTLRESYETLRSSIVTLFRESWPDIASGAPNLTEQSGRGTYHRSTDRLAHLAAMPQGWETRCLMVREYGRIQGLWLPNTSPDT